MTYEYVISFSQTRAIVVTGPDGYHIIINADLSDDEQVQVFEKALARIAEQDSTSPGQLFCLPFSGTSEYIHEGNDAGGQ